MVERKWKGERPKGKKMGMHSGTGAVSKHVKRWVEFEKEAEAKGFNSLLLLLVELVRSFVLLVVLLFRVIVLIYWLERVTLLILCIWCWMDAKVYFGSAGQTLKQGNQLFCWFDILKCQFTNTLWKYYWEKVCLFLWMSVGPVNA